MAKHFQGSTITYFLTKSKKILDFIKKLDLHKSIENSMNLILVLLD